MIRHFNVTVDAGLIDSDYRGLVYVLFANRSQQTMTTRTGKQVAQAVLFEKINVKFE